MKSAVDDDATEIPDLGDPSQNVQLIRSVSIYRNDAQIDPAAGTASRRTSRIPCSSPAVPMRVRQRCSEIADMLGITAEAGRLAAWCSVPLPSPQQGARCGHQPHRQDLPLEDPKWDDPDAVRTCDPKIWIGKQVACP